MSRERNRDPKWGLYALILIGIGIFVPLGYVSIAALFDGIIMLVWAVLSRRVTLFG